MDLEIQNELLKHFNVSREVPNLTFQGCSKTNNDFQESYGKSPRHSRLVFNSSYNTLNETQLIKKSNIICKSVFPHEIHHFYPLCRDICIFNMSLYRNSEHEVLLFPAAMVLHLLRLFSAAVTFT